jgi:hypothetical protein
MASTDSQRAVSQDGGIISRGQYFYIFAAVARVEKASLPPPREAARTLEAMRDKIVHNSTILWTENRYFLNSRES